ESGRKSTRNCERGGIDDRDVVGPGVGDVDLLTVGGKRNTGGHVAHGDLLDHFPAGDIDHAQLVALLAHYVERAAIGRLRHLDRIEIASVLSRGPRTDAENGGEKQTDYKCQL